MWDDLRLTFVSHFLHKWVVVCQYTMLWDKEFQSIQILGQ